MSDSGATAEADATAMQGGGFRLRDALSLLVLYVAVQIGGVAAIVVVFAHLGKDGGRAFLANPDGLNRLVVAGCAATAIAVVLLLRRIAQRRGLGRRGLGFAPVEWKWFWIAPALFVALQTALNGLSLIAGEDVAIRSLETMKGVVSSDPLWNLASAFFFVLVIPVIEELVFRVALFGALARRMPRAGAAVLSVAIFIAMHVQYTLAGGAVALLTTTEVTLLGAALMWLYMRSGSIWPSIAFHVANNGYAFIMLLVGF